MASADRDAMVERPLTGAEEDGLAQYFSSAFGHPFHYRFVYPAEIAPSAPGKYEVFRSEVATG